MLPRWSDEDAPLQSEGVKAPFIAPKQIHKPLLKRLCASLEPIFSSFMMLNGGPEMWMLWIDFAN
jgi:hypothetical protein